MAKKLFVGGLPFSVTNEELEEFFSSVGKVESAIVIMDRETNRSKGFGFVEMDDADADKAIEEFNGKQMSGRTITVNEARPREERPRRSFGGDNGGGNSFRRRY